LVFTAGAIIHTCRIVFSARFLRHSSGHAANPEQQTNHLDRYYFNDSH
jgi:hypothetical protein